MKSSPLNGAAEENEIALETGAKSSLWRRFKDFLKQFKRDLREPLPETANLPRWGKIKARFRHLFKRYGWKLLIAICVYYLIRDGILYILIPYLVAKKLLID